MESFPLAQSYMAINQLIARWVIIRTRLSHFDWEELIINFGIVNIIPRTFHLMGNLIIANQVDLEEESNNCYLWIILINNPNNYVVGPKYSMANKNIIPKDTLIWVLFPILNISIVWLSEDKCIYIGTWKMNLLL